MRKTRLTPMAANMFAIHVDSYHDGNMQGSVAGAQFAVPKQFKSLLHLILMLDDLMDEHEEAEMFSVNPIPADFEADIELEVLFRQHHSWQGRLRWIADGKEATFRSVLELLIILETILEP